jgi:ProP effector
LKVGIAAAIPARCPALEWGVLKMALTAYTGRVMYLRGLVVGAARVDLDGNPAGEVTARDAEYAAAKLAKILASRDTAAVAAKKPVTKPPAPTPSPAPLAQTQPPFAGKVSLKDKPVLRLAGSSVVRLRPAGCFRSAPGAAGC